MTQPTDLVFNTLGTDDVYTAAIPEGAVVIPGELPFLSVIIAGHIHVAMQYMDELLDVLSISCRREINQAIPQMA